LLLPKNQAEPVKHLGQFWISAYPLSGSVFGQRQHHALELEHAGLILLTEAEIALGQVIAGKRMSSAELDKLLAD
jgi:hypothetical protein